ncbi:MAG: multi-sensor hybrid histidine kinase [Flaviaesturariibacter sp.]|nr:multi-sensor hybrid histidine kinase [Flaviaesturariibacter sp.]
MRTKKLLSYRQPDIYVLFLALLVVSAIVAITVITNRNIDALQVSNRATSSSYYLKDKVNTLLSDVLLMESNQGGTLFSDSQYYQKGALSIAAVEADLKQLEPLVPPQYETRFKQLAFFVNRKIKFTWLVLNTQQTGSPGATRSLIMTGIGEGLRDSVNKYAGLLEYVFAQGVQSNLDLNSQKSEKLQPIITSMSVISFIAITALSCLIVYRIRHKNLLIRNLEDAYAREHRALEELELARQAAENSLQVKESFLANMSHEIRTPITAVLGFSSILQKSGLAPEQQKFLSYIQSSGSSLLSIVNDILDLSKLEAGMVRIEKLPFGIRELVGEVTDMFQSMATEKGLHLSLHIENDCPNGLSGDALRLKQVLTNLVANAVKFTQEGGITIMVRAMEESDDVARIRFRITDSGIGMTSAQLSKLFQRFEQGESDISRKFGGTGLGLAISKNLVELLGGTLEVESTPGEGTSFCVDIPFEKTDVAPAETPAAAPATKLRAGAKVLIVDDNQVNRMLVEYMLAEWGLSFASASNGREAIGMVKNDRFQLVLMDLQMPEMDGYSAARIIKTELQLSVPIVAMTAHVLPGEEKRCQENGMDGYISKPLQETDLHRLLARYLGDEPAAVPDGDQRFIDPSFLSNKFYGNEQFIGKILSQVQLQYPVELQVLADAVRARDTQAAAAAAHKIASTVSILHPRSGPMRWLQQIELCAMEQPACWTTIDGLVEKLRSVTSNLFSEAVGMSYPLGTPNEPA